MPPVRWKPTIVAVLICMLQATTSQLQDAISMTSDGWRPIIGTRKEQPITSYVNQYNNDLETYQTVLPTSTLPTAQKPHDINTNKPMMQIRGGKIPQQSQHKSQQLQQQNKKLVSINPFYGLTSHGVHGPLIPLNSVTHNRPGQSGQLKKHPLKQGYVVGNVGGYKNRKPVRNRDEVFSVSASSSAYTSSFNKGANKVKTRETVGLGQPQTHYQINQPHAHIEFNRFDPNFQSFGNHHQPTFLFPKNQQLNEINTKFNSYNKQQDDFVRNLVPPPINRHQLKQDFSTTEKAKLRVKDQKYQFQASQPIQVDVTKEKLNVFHNNIPSNYNPHQDYNQNYDYPDFQHHSLKTTPHQPNQVTYEVTEGKQWEESPPPQFILQQRRKPSAAPPPAAPASADVELNYPPFLPTPYSNDANPTSPTQAEISTIFAKLSNRPATPTPSANDYYARDVSTHFPIVGRPVFELEPASETTTMPAPPVRPTQRRRRPAHRTRTTTSTTLTPPQTDELVMVEEGGEKPQRRRPARYRVSSTPAPSGEEGSSEEVRVQTRGRYKHRPASEDYGKKRRRPIRYEAETSPPIEELVETTEDVSMEVISEAPQKRGRYEEATVTSTPITTTQKFVESTITDEIETSTEILTTTIPTSTTSTTSTTSPASTSIPKRIRTRPIKYDNSNRPRFSVKDYRLKLNTLTSTSTETPSSTTQRSVLRMRRPNHDDSGRFTPKRYTSTTSEPIITEKNVKAVNTRLRPFGRQRSTSTTSSPRVSIKPNLFSARRRPAVLSLRSKIQQKSKNGTEVTTVEPVPEIVTELESVEEEEEEEVPTTEHAFNKNKVDVPVTDEPGESTTTDIMKNESYIYSQRVSDLTSSSQNEYNEFKNVVAPTTSRRIPNYFTIATDDPILPIEAFFPNIKDKVA